MKSSQHLVTRHGKKNSPPQKQYLWLGGVYTIENKDTNTDYQKFVRVADQKWEIVEITVGIIFFCLRFLFTIYKEYSSPIEKNHTHLKCTFPSKILIWPKYLLHKCSEKWLIPPPIPSSPGGRGCKLWCCCNRCSFIDKTMSQFFENLIFSQEIWENVNYVCEINLIS